MSEMKSVAEQKKALRAAAEAQAALVKAKRKIVTYAGHDYELRPMTMGRARKLSEKANGSSEQASILSVIESTYTPGSDERVWDESDVVILNNQEVGGLVHALQEGLNELIKEAQAAGGKASGSTPSVEPSTGSPQK